MFLAQTIKRNPALIEAAFTLHRSGAIQPDTYLIDVDTLISNAERMLTESKKYGIRLYFMLKQLGRNPYIARKLVELGYHGVVCVDYREAQVMMEAGIPIGNVGHLVQIPDHMIEEIVTYRPELITVYSYEKVKRIDEVCKQLGLVQDILIRVYGPEDDIYSGQTAGFLLTELPDLISKIMRECSNIHIKGVTSFPCFLYDDEAGEIRPANNLFTVQKAVEILSGMGIRAEVVNTPSATCTYTMEQIKRYGGNSGEPGHGLTGTTPMHAVRELDEVPAVTYVSEISHNFMGQAYCYGGGYYRRSHVRNVLAGCSPAESKLLAVVPPDAEAIDYHLGISRECKVGDTAVMAFRFQMFVCRSDIALIEGLKSKTPRLVGIYDCAGRIRG